MVTRESIPMSRRVRWCRLLVLAGAACSFLAWGLIVWVDVESVLFTGPILFALGMAKVIMARPTRCDYDSAFVLGLGEAAVCTIFVGTVNLFSLSPRTARMPFTLMGLLYLLIATPGAWMAYQRAPRDADPRVCAGCGYLLIGLTEPRCPECGRRFDPALLPDLASGAQTRAEPPAGRH